MKQIRIDFTQDNPCLDGYILGHIREHNATELIITPPAILAENETVTSYVIAFSTGGRVIHSEPIEKAKTLSVKLWRQLTMFPVLGVQLEAYDSDGEFIGKSGYVTGLRLLPSAHGVETNADTDNPDFVSVYLKTKHSHENKDILDEFSKTEDGALLFEGKPIESGSSASLNIEVKTNTEDEYVLVLKTDEEIIETPNLIGPEGKQGESGVYVGEGEMPEEYNIQINPNGASSDAYFEEKIENALAAAKASGDFDGADGQDGSSAYQIWLNAGNTGTEEDFLASLKGDTGAVGEDGADGYTPVLGVDYWTAEDKETIQDDCNTYIATELAKRGQLKPEFANSLEECTDITKLYVLPDGYIYGYVKTTEYPEITIEGLSGGYWYLNGTTEAYHTTDGVCSKQTNYISVTEGDTFLYTGQEYIGKEINASFYDANKTYISSLQLSDANSGVTVTVPAGASFVRFYSFRYTDSPDNVVLTVDWVTCAGATSYRFTSTGHAFVPADYEDEIIALDNRITILENGVDTTLKGKKIVYDGDSICALWTGKNDGAYPKLIADVTGCNYDNQAVGGGVFRTDESRHSIVDNLANLPTDGDLYCFEGGVNDHWNETPLGDFSESDYTGDVDIATFCGAVEQVCRYSINNFVGKPICFVITHKCPYSAYSQNSLGLTFADYREKMIGILEKYSIPYYDAFNESGLNGMNDVQKANFFVVQDGADTGDGTHPNAEGYKRYYVPQLIALFRKIMPIE